MTPSLLPIDRNTPLALCPDGERRPYTVKGGDAFVDLSGVEVRGSVDTDETGQTVFRAAARHAGAHRMWYPQNKRVPIIPAPVNKAFDPLESRDAHGEWTSIGGSGDEGDDYRGQHRSPSPDYADPMHALGVGENAILPGDMYDKKTQMQHYGGGPGAKQWDQESFAAVNAAEGKPDQPTTIYRAAPAGTTEINPGDFVTASRSYAEQHNTSNLDGKGVILSRTVPAKELYTNGDSINEWGWHPDSLIAPHNSKPTPTKSGRGGAKENAHATSMEGIDDPKYAAAMLDTIKTNSPQGDLTPEKMDANLESLWQSAQQDPTAMGSRHWYNIAHDRAANDVAKVADIPFTQGACLVATLSPQTDWYSNIAVAGFLAKTLKADPLVNLPTNIMEHYGPMAAKQSITIPNGKHLSEMNPGEASFALMGLIRNAKLKSEDTNKDGKNKAASVSMGSKNIAKAVMAFRGQRPDDILSGHKVRSFYNNIVDPEDKMGRHDVTIDTHMLSAMAGYRIGAKAKLVDRIFTSGFSNKRLNIASAYPVYADAVRRGAARHANDPGFEGMTPDQYQAIIWTHWQDNGKHRGKGNDFPEVPVNYDPRVDGKLQLEGDS